MMIVQPSVLRVTLTVRWLSSPSAEVRELEEALLAPPRDEEDTDTELRAPLVPEARVDALAEDPVSPSSFTQRSLTVPSAA